MSIGSINQNNIFNSPSPPIAPPQSVSLDSPAPAAGGEGVADPSATATTSNATTGSGNPFDSLAAALQAWLNQAQSQVQPQTSGPGLTPAGQNGSLAPAQPGSGGAVTSPQTASVTSLSESLSQDMARGLQAYGSTDVLAGVAFFGGN